MSTTIEYNGVELRECDTKAFHQDLEYDESGTDALFSRFRIRVSSMVIRIVGEPADVQFIRNPAGFSIADRLDDIQTRLNAPRKDFQMILETGRPAPDYSGNPREILLAATGSTAGTMQVNDGAEGAVQEVDRIDVVDVDNGPKPRSVVVTQIYGGNAVHVEFEIEVCRRLCVDQLPDSAIGAGGFSGTKGSGDNSGNDPKPGGIVNGTELPNRNVLSNRWSLTESRDANWAVTRMLRGKLRVVHESVWPHAMRYLVVPPLLFNFQRKGQRYTEDPTGLVLQYEITDVERSAAPPSPAVDWDGFHSEASTNNAGVQVGEIRLKLIGMPTVDKNEMIQAGAWFIGQRVQGLRLIRKGGLGENLDAIRAQGLQAHIIDAAVVNVLSEPVIEFRLRYRLSDPSYKGLAMRIRELGRMTFSPDYDPRLWSLPFPHGTKAPVNLLHCYLQNPCSRWHQVPALSPYASQAGDAEEPPIPVRSPHSLTDSQPQYLRLTSTMRFGAADEDDSAVSGAQFAGAPITHFFVKNTYYSKSGVVHIPFAGQREQRPPLTDSTASPNNGESSDDSNSDSQAPLLSECAFLQIHRGITTRVFEVEAVRDDRLPSIPDPQQTLTSAGIREELLEAETVLCGPELNADDVTRKYKVRARYVYGLERTPSGSDRLRMATSPIDNLEPFLVDRAVLYADSAKIDLR